MKPCRCIPTPHALGVIFIGDPEECRGEIDRQCDHALNVTITAYGFDILLGVLCIPVPASLFDHLAETGGITCYAGREDAYELVPVYHLPIPPSLVIESKGAFKYHSLANEGERARKFNPLPLVFG